MPDVRVGIVTVTYNSEPVLEDFLESVAGQVDVDVRLFVIDNASHDASLRMVRDFGEHNHAVLVANDDNLGVAVGNNQGIELALDDGCDWVFILNNDTVFGPSTISDLVREAEKNALDIVVPLIEATEPPDTVWFQAGHYVPWQGYRTFHDETGAPVADFPKVLAPTQYAPTCALLVRPAVFAKVGRMDPVYFVYFDDVDFAVRCHRAGYQYWVTPAARVIHKASSLTGGKASPFTIRWTSRNWPLIARRQLPPLRSAVALAYIQMWMLARACLGRDSWSIFRQRQAGFRDGVRAASAPPPGFFDVDRGGSS